MLVAFTVFVMAAVAYVYLGEGLVTASIMCINVLLAGLVAFDFFEPLADAIANQFSGSSFADYADTICLIGLFALTLGLLRLATNTLQPLQLELQGAVQSLGGAAFGLVTGYLVAGFLICVFQTLPLPVNFLGFDPAYEATAGLRNYLPADRVWLGLMQFAGAHGLSNGDDESRNLPVLPDELTNRRIDGTPTFDKYGTFEMRYARYRRYGDNRDPTVYSGEFGAELAGPAR